MSFKTPHPIDLHVGLKIKTFRCERKLPQSALARQLGVTFQQIEKYERGATRVSSSKLFEIAAALEVEVTAFFINLPQASRRGERSSLDIERAAFAVSSEGVRLLDAYRALPSHPRHVTLGMIVTLAECFRAKQRDAADADFPESQLQGGRDNL